MFMKYSTDYNDQNSGLSFKTYLVSLTLSTVKLLNNVSHMWSMSFIIIANNTHNSGSRRCRGHLHPPRVWSTFKSEWVLLEVYSCVSLLGRVFGSEGPRVLLGGTLKGPPVDGLPASYPLVAPMLQTCYPHVTLLLSTWSTPAERCSVGL